MDLNREQVIAALECHADNRDCANCPYTDTQECSTELAKDALSIIEELIEEVKAMEGTANSYKRLSVDLAKQVGSLKDELAKRPEPLIITKLPKKKK